MLSLPEVAVWALSALADSGRAAGSAWVRVVPIGDLSGCSKWQLLDDLVSASKQRYWEGKTEGFGGLEIDDELHFYNLLDG